MICVCWLVCSRLGVFISVEDEVNFDIICPFVVENCEDGELAKVKRVISKFFGHVFLYYLKVFC